MNKRCGCALLLSLAALLLAPQVLGQEAKAKMPATKGTGCEPATCASKVLYLPNFSQPNDLQDMVNMFRAILEMWHVTPNQSERAISLQGTPEQIAIAEKLMNVLEDLRSSGSPKRSSVLVHEPAGSLPEAAVPEKVSERSPVAPETRCELTTCSIQALYLPDCSIGKLQDSVNKLRSMAHVARIVMIPSSHAIVLEGNSQQLAFAEKLIKE